METKGNGNNGENWRRTRPRHNFVTTQNFQSRYFAQLAEGHGAPSASFGQVATQN